MNADAASAIVEGRKYTEENQIWASLRMAGYGPVLTRLVMSAVEEDVTRREVFNLLKSTKRKVLSHRIKRLKASLKGHGLWHQRPVKAFHHLKHIKCS